MSLKPTFEVGGIVRFPYVGEAEDEFNGIVAIITLPPHETLWQSGYIILSERFTGTARYAWQVDVGRYYIDCMKFYQLSEKNLLDGGFEVIGQIPENKIEILRTSWDFAEDERRFRGKRF